MAVPQHVNVTVRSCMHNHWTLSLHVGWRINMMCTNTWSHRAHQLNDTVKYCRN